MSTGRAKGRHSSLFPLLNRRLMPDEWPASDRAAWELACAPGRALTPPGEAAHLREATRFKHTIEWGLYLRYLSTMGLLEAEADVAQRLSPTRLGDYIVALLDCGSARSIRARVMQLSYAIAEMAPQQDWAWVRKHPAIPSEREAQASAKPKDFCDPGEITAKALELMDTAETLPSPLLAAVRYRDGLIIALGFWSVLRRRNLCELKIGQSIVLAPDYIRIIFEASQVKNHRVIEMTVPAYLAERVRRYVDFHRPILLQGAADTGELWINLRGRPVAYAAMYGIFMGRSQSMIGKPLSPHATRYSLASSRLAADPRDLELVACSLAHNGLSTVQRYYDQSSCLAASAVWQKLLVQRGAAGDESAGEQ